MNAARLPEARLRFPDWAANEREAECRVRICASVGDIAGGAKALADWIDAQALMLACLEIYGLSEGRPS